MIRRLFARARTALARLVHGHPAAVLEDICWCGIHHLGDYIHYRTPATSLRWIPEITDPATPAPEAEDGTVLFRIDPPKEAHAVAGFVAAAVRDARVIEDTMARVNETLISKVDALDFLLPKTLDPDLLQEAIASIEGTPGTVRLKPAQVRIDEAVTAERARLLGELEKVRHRDHTHPATPNTYFWGITVAERIIRGEQP